MQGLSRIIAIVALVQQKPSDRQQGVFLVIEIAPILARGVKHKTSMKKQEVAILTD